MVSDRAYLPWTGTTIASCARACVGWRVNVHLLHSPDVGGTEQRQMKSMADGLGVVVDFHPIDEAALEVLPTKGPSLGGRMSWVRVLLPQLLEGVDRVVYLDGDTLVVSSLEPLWNLPLEGAPVAAVANVTERAMYPHVLSLGLDDPNAYFNAGVLVVDLTRWRDEGASEALVSFVSSRAEGLPWFDQDAMNAVFAGRWKALHPRWNTMNSFWTWDELAADLFGADVVGEARADPAILHFEGPSLCKPWHYLCEHPWRDRYRALLRQTPWAAEPLVDRTLMTQAIARLPHAGRLPAYRWLHRVRSRRERFTSRA
jgi:lipopolysaccharide biosynthesis glycosyltransferase